MMFCSLASCLCEWDAILIDVIPVSSGSRTDCQTDDTFVHPNR